MQPDDAPDDAPDDESTPAPKFELKDFRWDIYRARRTALEMLRDRMYMISESDINQTEADFQSMFPGDERTYEEFMDAHSEKADGLTILAQKRDSPTDSVLVFWPRDEKVGIKQIRRYVERMTTMNVTCAIIISREPLTSFAAKGAIELASEHKIKLENFMTSSLFTNITHHNLVPQHVLLTKTERITLLKRYKLTADKLPRIIKDKDPICKYYGAERGEIFKIVRASETAGKYVTYRVVV